MVQPHSKPWRRSMRYLPIALLPFALACGSSLKTQSVKVTPAAPAASAGPSQAPAAAPVAGSGPDTDRGIEPALPGRPEGARAGPFRGGESRIRPGGRRAARVAVRRANRAADPRTFRSPGRPHQRLRSQGARRGRRFHRKEIRAGLDRRAAGGVDDVRPSRGAARADRDAFSRTSRHRPTTFRSRSTSACCPTSSCSRAACTTSSRTA